MEKIAPWLLVDSDPYPAIVDGKVLWILDGYTTSDRYPNSQRESLEEMTRDTLRPTTSFVTLPTDQINYMRNSVKVTVDAYDGTVTLYEWDKDPILEAWESIFPDVVKPKSDISPELEQHLRYPEDLFKVQRSVLAQYHIEEPQLFYQGTDRWQVPPDPADPTESKKQPPYRLSVQMPLPSGEEGEPEAPRFSLTSVFTPFNRKNLASFIAVDSDASSSDYGKIRILTLPEGTQVDGPSLIANTFGTDGDIQATLQPLKLNQRISNGNLLTLPVGGGLLYVQPVYASQTRAEGSFPVLRYVMATFGDRAGIGRTLADALANIRDEAPADPDPDPDPDPGDGDGNTSKSVLELLEDIEAKQGQADAALRNGNLVRYAELQNDITRLIQRAVAAARADNQTPTPTPTPSP